MMIRVNDDSEMMMAGRNDSSVSRIKICTGIVICTWPLVAPPISSLNWAGAGAAARSVLRIQ